MSKLDMNRYEEAKTSKTSQPLDMGQYEIVNPPVKKKLNFLQQAWDVIAKQGPKLPGAIGRGLVTGAEDVVSGLSNADKFQKQFFANLIPDTPVTAPLKKVYQWGADVDVKSRDFMERETAKQDEAMKNSGGLEKGAFTVSRGLPLMGAALSTGPAAPVVFGTVSAGRGAREAEKVGASSIQQATHGSIVGIVDGLTSMPVLGSLAKTITAPAKTALVHYLLSVPEAGLQGMVSSIANGLSKQFVYNPDQFMTNDQIDWQKVGEAGKESLVAGGSNAGTALILGGMGMGLNKAKTTIKDVLLGKSAEAPALHPEVRPEQIQPEPVQPEPVQPEPVQPEPVQPEPVRPEPVRPEPVRPEPPIEKRANLELRQEIDNAPKEEQPQIINIARNMKRWKDKAAAEGKTWAQVMQEETGVNSRVTGQSESGEKISPQAVENSSGQISQQEVKNPILNFSEWVKNKYGDISDLSAGAQDLIKKEYGHYVGAQNLVNKHTINELPDGIQKVYYRGATPGETRRIKTGVDTWDNNLFVADNVESALPYGEQIEAVALKDGAKVLTEGSKEFNRIKKEATAGKDYSANQTQRLADIVMNAKSKGFDVVEFKKQSDVGTVVLNPDKVIRNYQPGSLSNSSSNGIVEAKSVSPGAGNNGESISVKGEPLGTKQAASSSEEPLEPKLREGYTHTLANSTKIPDDVKESLGINSEGFMYDPETNAKQQQTAESNIANNRAEVRQRLENPKGEGDNTSGVEMYEAAILTTETANKAMQTQSKADFAEANNVAQLAVERVGEHGAGLQAWKAAFDESSPEDALITAHKVVKKAQDEVTKKKPMVKEKVKKEVKQTKDAVEKAEKDAAAMLAAKVMDTVKEKKAPIPDDMVDRMVAELYRMAKESPLPQNKSKTKPTDPRAFLQEALANKERYGETWDSAKEIVESEFADDPEALAKLRDYFDKGIIPPYSEASLKKSIAVGQKDLEQKIIDLAKGTAEEQTKAIDDLADYLVGSTGATKEDAARLASQIADQVKPEIAARAEKELARTFKPKSEKPETDTLKSVKELANLGAFKTDTYTAKLGEKLTPTVKKLLKESSLDLGKLVRRSVEDVNFTRDMFLLELEAKLKINRQDATAVLKHVETIFDGLAGEKKLQILNSMFKKRTVDIKVKPLVDKVVELINLGAYNDVAITNIIKEQNKLPVLTDVDAKSILNIVRDARELPEGSFERKQMMDKAKKIIANKTPITFGEAFNEVTNIPRSVMASVDFSAPFRQGLFLSNHPKKFFGAFPDMFKAFGSERGLHNVQQSIRDNPNYELMKKSGLGLTELDDSLSLREERFMSNLAEKIPVGGKILRASARAYTAFLNKLRADVFNEIVTKAEVTGNKELCAEIANFVNTFSGRGTWGKADAALSHLNGVFFSPRLMASRLTILNPVYYIKSSPVVRREALKSVFTTLGLAASVMSLAKLGGAQVCTDPRNSDFAKIKVGNTRIDILGGLQQYIRMIAQVTTGKYISSTTGKEVNLGEGYKPLTRLDIILRQAESKEAPVPAFATKLLRGQDYKGQPLDIPKETLALFKPIIVSDIEELIQSDPKLIPLEVLNLFGFGVQTYAPYTPKPKEVKSTRSGRHPFLRKRKERKRFGER